MGWTGWEGGVEGWKGCGDGGCCYGDWGWRREGVEVGEVGCGMAGWFFMGDESGSVSGFLVLRICLVLTGKGVGGRSRVQASIYAEC